MLYFTGALLELPLVDPGIVLFLFFPLAVSQLLLGRVTCPHSALLMNGGSC
jgi:hypothetical protein